jgi:hypothetical protein
MGSLSKRVSNILTLSDIKNKLREWVSALRGRRGPGLPPDWADDFVIAVHEIAVNAVQYGSPAARLLPLMAGPAGWGLALARRVCDGVEIRAGRGGTTMRRGMSLSGAAWRSVMRCRSQFPARRPGCR